MGQYLTGETTVAGWIGMAVMAGCLVSVAVSAAISLWISLRGEEGAEDQSGTGSDLGTSAGDVE